MIDLADNIVRLLISEQSVGKRRRKKKGRRGRKKGKGRKEELKGGKNNGNSTAAREIGEMNDVISICLSHTTPRLLTSRDHTFTVL